MGGAAGSGMMSGTECYKSVGPCVCVKLIRMLIMFLDVVKSATLPEIVLQILHLAVALVADMEAAWAAGRPVTPVEDTGT